MKFTSFALKKELINALNGLGYIDATKVQDVVIPKALKNENGYQELYWYLFAL